jgi:hypothetical protein
MHDTTDDGVELFWLPLGAGGFVVRRICLWYEARAARRDRRPAQPLFHSALRVTVGGSSYIVEMAPVWNLSVPQRGVVAEGAVGHGRLGRWRAFRYEVRCWAGGRIPDVAEAIDSPLRVADDTSAAVRVLELVPLVPPLTWGRDELQLGEMWNSNSLVAWLLAGSDIDVADVRPPLGGRAPGWEAGLRLAHRDQPEDLLRTAGTADEVGA